jgi:hypothetical protein
MFFIGYIICPAIYSHNFQVKTFLFLQNDGMDIEGVDVQTILIIVKFLENCRL